MQNTMKKFQRMKQQATEALGRGEKSDKLTQKLAVVEKKVEGIRLGVQVTTKKLSGTIMGSGSTLDKHQRKLPQYGLGLSMMEQGSALGTTSLFGSVLMMVGQAQQDIASQLANYEITIAQEIIAKLNSTLEEDTKPVDKCKKKLGNARLDMDSARARLRHFEQQIEKSTREYNMEKLNALKMEVDESTRKFEECQDAYATSMYEFISKEQEYTDMIQQLVKLQITNYKNAAAQLEGMIPVFEKKMNETQARPVFGMPLAEHLRVSKRDIAAVIETCCAGLRKEWMDTEGLFRIAGGQAKVKFLKTSFDAGQFDVSTHDPHTIAGCLKMYLRELPEPLLTYALYNEWMAAAGVGDHQTRLTNLWTVKEKLQEPNLSNFKYLVAFLHEFAQYQDITKMSVSNIAIVIGPNLLWPEKESDDPGRMVTETALQRTLTEAFLEHATYFFPDIADLTNSSSSSSKTSPPSSVTFTGSSSSSFSPTSLQSYTSKSAENFSPPPQGTNHLSSPTHRPVAPPTKEKEVELPHPLAESADDQGVKVLVDEKSSSPKPFQRNVSNSPAPSSNLSDTPNAKSRSLPRTGVPVPTPRMGSSTNLTPPDSPSFSHKTPPSPAPRPRQGTSSSISSTGSGGSVARTPSAGEMSLGSAGSGEGQVGGRGADSATMNNGRGEETTDHGATPPRPTPPVRTKRGTVHNASMTPPTPSKPPPYLTPPSGTTAPGSGTLERRAAANARAPARRAPPPPKARPKAVVVSGSDELTSL